MGIQINGVNDTISAGDGSLSIQGSDLTNLSQLSVTGVGTFKTLVLAADGSEKARIDSSGRLLVGTATSITSDTNSVIEATNALGAHVALGRFDTVINGGEVIGKLSFNSNDHDGAGTIWQECASITANADGVYRLNDKPTRLVFSTTADEASSPTEQLRITSDRYVRLASGTGGIQFNGDTAAANALDDYEEGTWTPVISDGVNTGSVSVLSCRYTKIGRLVYVRGTLLNINTTGLTAGNNLIVAGLPYALLPNVTNSRLAFPVATTNITTTKGLAAGISNNETSFLLYEVDNAIFGATPLQVSDFTSGNADIFIGFSYETA